MSAGAETARGRRRTLSACLVSITLALAAGPARAQQPAPDEQPTTNAVPRGGAGAILKPQEAPKDAPPPKAVEYITPPHLR